MRIGFIIYGDINDISGGYLYNRALVAYLQHQGHQVDIISLPLRRYWQHLFDNFKPVCRQPIMAANIDLVIEDHWAHPSLLRFNRWLSSRGIPVISLIHLLTSFEQHPWYSAWFYPMIERFYLKSVNGIIANSQLTLSQVQNLVGYPHNRFPAHCLALPAGNNFAEICSGLDNILQHTLKPGPFRILVVGNVIRRKGLHVVIRALSQLPLGEYQVIVAGRLDMEPDYVAEIYQLIQALQLQPFIILKGPIAGEPLVNLYRQHHLMALPSAYESYGIVYVEAQQFGLPVIGTQAGAAKEIIEHGKNGFLIPPEDFQALATILQTLHHQRHLLLQLSQNALAYYAKHPTWDDTGNIIHQFLIQQLA